MSGGPGTGPAGDADGAGRSYEELLAELETLIERMADGRIGIEEATEMFERATKLHALASDRLRSIEARIAALAPPPPPAELG